MNGDAAAGQLYSPPDLNASHHPTMHSSLMHSTLDTQHLDVQYLAMSSLVLQLGTQRAGTSPRQWERVPLAKCLQDRPTDCSDWIPDYLKQVRPGPALGMTGMFGWDCFHCPEDIASQAVPISTLHVRC